MAAVYRRMPFFPSLHVQYHETSLIRRFSTTNSNQKILAPLFGQDPHLQSVGIHKARFDRAHVSDFRKLAFEPEKPLLLTPSINGYTSIDESFPIPAAFKWFTRQAEKLGRDGSKTQTSFKYHYLDQFGDHLVNFEVISEEQPPDRSHIEEKFFRIQAPLSTIISSSKDEKAANGPVRQKMRFYLAQTQIIDLPKKMQEDIVTPHLVNEAGNGDIYDANVWIGQAPTYTPLHKDPNPNLFVQVASEKVVRLYEPKVGAAIFNRVQRSLGANASPVFRGEEMMEGPERKVLDEAVWGETANNQGYEAYVKAGDALFIPKGWWHSIKSVGPDINASVNWWFR